MNMEVVKVKSGFVGSSTSSRFLVHCYAVVGRDQVRSKISILVFIDKLLLYYIQQKHFMLKPIALTTLKNGYCVGMENAVHG